MQCKARRAEASFDIEVLADSRQVCLLVPGASLLGAVVFALLSAIESEPLRLSDLPVDSILAKELLDDRRYRA
eukprot:557747-Prymnesium_polylepis.1